MNTYNCRLIKQLHCLRFEVLTAVRMVMLFFWVLAPYRLIGRCQPLDAKLESGRIYIGLCKSLHFPASPLQPWRWKKYVSPKRWHLPTSLHGAKIQNNNIISLWTVWDSSRCHLEHFLSLLKATTKTIWKSSGSSVLWRNLSSCLLYSVSFTTYLFLLAYRMEIIVRNLRSDC
jgi:hypothetical protein